MDSPVPTSPGKSSDRIGRRRFVQAAAAAAVAARGLPAVLAAPAERGLAVGIIGCARGRLLAREFAAQNARILYACDPDETRREKVRSESGAREAVADMRRVLDDKNVEAVVIATPDHWHAPAALLACQAGKHVYVEKPCSHNIHEGRLMIEAARRSGRVMAVGSQSRSTTVLANAIRLVAEGAIGDVLMAKAWNSQRRPNIGRLAPSEPPPKFDYDLWVGPAPMRPFQANCHHYTWHWWYDFGTGDVGNDGIHELDIAAWGLGVTTHPSIVAGHGSKMFFDDDQQFPDTQYVTFEYPAQGSRGRRLIVYEQRIWTPYVQEGHENGNAFCGTEGYLILAKEAGWQLYGPKNRLLKQEEGKYSVPEHVTDFLAAVRDGGQPSADIEVGHRSATLAHLANILARAGRQRLLFDPATERIADDPQADALTRRTYRQGHWAVPNVI